MKPPSILKGAAGCAALLGGGEAVVRLGAGRRHLAQQCGAGAGHGAHRVVRAMAGRAGAVAWGI